MDKTEKLADLIHDIWAEWVLWQFEFCSFNDDGTATIRADKVDRWKRQTATPYASLSDPEKESDRKIARRIMRLLEDAGSNI